MEYNFLETEDKWRKFWAENKTNQVIEDKNLPKYYVLDMFPYPSGAGLHVGHPLGYIASDIFARYKKLQGFNVLHPMGYDSFGLPAEQYAIQTGQHPAITTETNIARYREQLDKMGFCFDWDREVRTSSPEYYKWTQWIFKQLFNAWFNNDTQKSERIETLIARFEENGNAGVHACTDYEETFSDVDWKNFSNLQKENILQEYRMAYLADSWVNWCPALGTVLANDEIVNGVSERGGHPVVQKLMRQWSMRIKAYAQRLLDGLETLDWTDSIKEIQRNWIGKSEGCSVFFPLWRGTEGEDSGKETEHSIEVFTTRPDTIFGVSFMVLAPEHELVDLITTPEQKETIEAYKKEASLKSERDRQSDVKNITGAFTGAYAIHPFSGEKIQIWIGDYVLASYGTGAVMAVPCGDQRDWDFAKHFGINIINIFENVDVSEAAYADKEGTIANSDFLSGLPIKKAMKLAIHKIEEAEIGKGKILYRLRDAIFSRQRYWGEPFPVYFENDIPKLVADDKLPIRLPEVDKYLPTEEGEPPLARATKDAWKEQFQGDRMEYNTMPGWAGSSWYFLRYMDPHNENEFVAKEKVEYWNNVDLYIGGAEHGTGHLLYSRFWTKFLHDLDYIPFDEPFQKMINQGMILGRSSFVQGIYIYFHNYNSLSDLNKENKSVAKDVPRPIFLFITKDKFKEIEDSNLAPIDNWIEKRFPDLTFVIDEENLKSGDTTYVLSTYKRHVDIKYVENDILNIQEASKDPLFDFLIDAEFILEDDGTYICGHEVEKMSKSKYNVQTPDELVEKFGADTLRMYEMFLGPLEQSKPWDTKGISGVSNFLRKFWRLFHNAENNFSVVDELATKDMMKTLHKTIKKIGDDLERFSFNTGVSTFMICVNELTEQKCNHRQVLQPLVVLLSPFAPHIAEELWSLLGHETSVTKASFPEFDESHLVETTFEYPVSFNGKMRFKVTLDLSLSVPEMQKEILAMEQTQKYLEGKEPKKVIIVPGRIVNFVV